MCQKQFRLQCERSHNVGVDDTRLVCEAWGPQMVSPWLTTRGRCSPLQLPLLTGTNRLVTTIGLAVLWGQRESCSLWSASSVLLSVLSNLLCKCDSRTLVYLGFVFAVRRCWEADVNTEDETCWRSVTATITGYHGNGQVTFTADCIWPDQLSRFRREVASAEMHMFTMCEVVTSPRWSSSFFSHSLSVGIVSPEMDPLFIDSLIYLW